MEPLKPVVVHLELPVHQHRNVVGARDLVDTLHLRGVAFHPELLFGDDDGATLQIAFDLSNRARDIRDLVGAEAECFRMRLREAMAGFVTEGLRLQPVCHAGVSGGAIHSSAGRKKNGCRDAQGALMGQQDVIGAAAVSEVLMDVDDRIGLSGHRRGLVLGGSTRRSSAGRGQSDQAGEDLATG